MPSIYRNILKDSFQMTLKNRWLWFLGLFAAVLGNGGIFNVLIKNISFIQDEGVAITEIEQIFNQGTLGAVWLTIVELFNNLNLVSILTMLVIVVLSLFILWLAIVTQGSLISGVFRIYKSQPTGLKESWRRGLSKFWPVLGLNITTKLIIYLLLAVFGIPFLSLYIITQNLAWQWAVLVMSFMILIPVAILISLIVQYAVIFVVSKNNSYTIALKEGWNLFKKNPLVSIEMAFILFVVNILVGLGLLIAATVVLVPFFLLGFLAVYISSSGLFNLALILGLIVLALTLFLVGALLAVFQASAWVILFSKLTEGTIIPKIVRALDKKSTINS